VIRSKNRALARGLSGPGKSGLQCASGDWELPIDCTIKRKEDERTPGKSAANLNPPALDRDNFSCPCIVHCLLQI